MTIVEESHPSPAPAEEEVPVKDETDEEAAIEDEEPSGLPTTDGGKSIKTKRSADWSRNRRSSIRFIMKEKKREDRIDLGENIYSLLIVSPTFSWPFLFCIGVYFIKIAILAILLSDIRLTELLEEDPKVTVVKFCLIPVAVAMQEDMMYSFFFYANVIYDPAILEASPAATKGRFIFSYLLRTIDGIMSLFSNYFIMLITDVTLDVFLNFAALQFLYDIDDVFYELVTQGFFGDGLESYAKICEEITMVRRLGKDNKKIFWFFRISWMDTILFCTSLLICYTIFAIVTVSKYNPNVSLIIGTAAPSMSFSPSGAPSMVPSDFPSLMPSITSLLANATEDVF